MKYTVSIAVMALLGFDQVQAVSNNRSMLDRAAEEDAILAGTSAQWSDVGFTQTKGAVKNEDIDVNDENTSIQSMSQKKNAANRATKMKSDINEKESSDKNKKLFKNINEKLQDKSFIASAIENTTPVITNEARPDTEVRKSDDEVKLDQSDRKTDAMMEVDKVHEDGFYAGHQNTGKVDGGLPQEEKKLPNGHEQVAPVNQPKHLNAEDFKTPKLQTSSASGVSIVYLTVDTEEHATRFIKDLFKQKLCATVTLQEGGFERSYLKFGRPSTESGRMSLEITTENGKVTELVDYINHNNPTEYDYPVPNVTVLPVADGNKAYLDWVKSNSGKGLAL